MQVRKITSGMCLLFSKATVQQFPPQVRLVVGEAGEVENLLKLIFRRALKLHFGLHQGKSNFFANLRSNFFLKVLVLKV